MKRGGPLKRYTPLRSSSRLGKRAKKPRQPKASTLKKKLWKLFSEYIRRRAADHSGIAQCVSCGLPSHWQSLQGGHYVRASAGMNTYFDEQNVHPQCVRCNIFLDGNIQGYTLYMVNTYGLPILTALDERRRIQRKISIPEYLELIETYKSKLAALPALPEAA